MASKVTTGISDMKQTVLKARVHCVDVTTRELLYAWLFEIEVVILIEESGQAFDSEIVSDTNSDRQTHPLQALVPEPP